MFRSALDLGGVSETGARTPLLQEQGGVGGLEEAGAAGAGDQDARGQGDFWVERDAADIEIGDRLRLFQ